MNSNYQKEAITIGAKIGLNPCNFGVLADALKQYELSKEYKMLTLVDQKIASLVEAYSQSVAHKPKPRITAANAGGQRTITAFLESQKFTKMEEDITTLQKQKTELTDELAATFPLAHYARNSLATSGIDDVFEEALAESVA